MLLAPKNWNRPKEEISALMDLLVQSIYNEVDELNNKGVKLATIGDVHFCQLLVKRLWMKQKKALKIILK